MLQLAEEVVVASCHLSGPREARQGRFSKERDQALVVESSGGCWGSGGSEVKKLNKKEQKERPEAGCKDSEDLKK